MSKTNPFLFAGGVPRSGTTLLQRMLNHHPELAVANDTHFIPRALELTDKSLISKALCGQPIPLTEKLADQVRQYHRFWRMQITETEFREAVGKSETYQQLVAALYQRFAERSHRPYAGEKTPDYARRLNLLHGLFPNAKLIHLVRDGRNVALSLMQWAGPGKGPGRIPLWQKNPLAVSALWWRWMVLEARKQATNIDARCCLTVSYEALVQEPETCLRKVCRFLGLAYSSQMVAYHQGRSKRNSRLSPKSAWLAPQPGLRNWNSQMNGDDVLLFEAIAGDALRLYGYETQIQGIPANITEQSLGYRKWWQQHFVANWAPAAVKPGANVAPGRAMTQSTGRLCSSRRP